MNAREAINVLDKVRDLLEKPEVADDALAELDGYLDYDKLYDMLHLADEIILDAMELIGKASGHRVIAIWTEKENNRYAASMIA